MAKDRDGEDCIFLKLGIKFDLVLPPRQAVPSEYLGELNLELKVYYIRKKLLSKKLLHKKTRTSNKKPPLGGFCVLLEPSFLGPNAYLDLEVLHGLVHRLIGLNLSRSSAFWLVNLQIYAGIIFHADNP